MGEKTDVTRLLDQMREGDPATERYVCNRLSVSWLVGC